MVNEQEELDKCDSLEEGVGYLKYKDECSPQATLEDYRNSVLSGWLPVVELFLYWTVADLTKRAKLLNYFVAQTRKRGTIIYELENVAKKTKPNKRRKRTRKV